MPSLFDPSQRGGAIAGAGFNFQDAYIVLSMPTWLVRGGFYSLLKEGFDDVDVRFDDVEGTSIWHYQLKDHSVSPKEFREVVKGFSAKSAGDRTKYILGCCGLSATLAPMWRRVQEFRGATQTHPPEALSVSRSVLEADLQKLGCGQWSEFVIDRLDVEHENPWLRETIPIAMLERFRGRFLALSAFGRPEIAALDRLFHLLLARVNRSIRVGIPLSDIETLIAAELAEATRGPLVSVHLHGWIKQGHPIPPDQEIDWTEHFDHETLRVPAPHTWESELLPQLRRLRSELDADSSKRNLRFAARAPLSAGLAFGQAFAEAAGYTIEIEQPSPAASGGQEVWRMGKVEALGLLEVVRVEGMAQAADIAIGIGITADPRPAVESFAARSGLEVKGALYMYPKIGPSVTAVTKDNVGAYAALIKDEMRRFISQKQPGIIHLFYVGPLGLAVLLGQRLNGLGDVQCYERSKTDGYAPSCRLLA